MVMIIVHDRCFVFDGSEVLFKFDKELDLCFDAFDYVGVCI
jgi:hypothetical protein